MRPVTLIEGAHIGEIPPTPLTPLTDLSPIKQAAELLVKFAKHYGIPTGYKQEQNGRLVHSIAPNPKTEFDQISSSSKIDLQLHTETAFHPFKPSHLLLMCLRGDENALTTYALVDEIVESLDDWTVDQLCRDAYITSVDDSFRQNGEPDQEIRMPILKKTEDGYEMCFDEFLMRGIDDESNVALINLKTEIPNHVQSIALKTADVLVLDNRKTIHGRKAFKPRYDGTDRWLLRTLVVDRCPPTAQQKILDHMVITTDFGFKVHFGEHPYNWGRK